MTERSIQWPREQLEYRWFLDTRGRSCDIVDDSAAAAIIAPGWIESQVFGQHRPKRIMVHTAWNNFFI